MRWLATLVVVIVSFGSAHGSSGALSVYESVISSRYLGTSAYWGMLTAVITRVIVPEINDDTIGEPSSRHVKFEVRSVWDGTSGEHLPPAFPHGPRLIKEEPSSDELGMPQIKSNYDDEAGAWWSTMGTSFVFKLLDDGKIGYTIDGSEIIPEGFMVGKQIRFHLSESSETYTGSVIDLNPGYEGNTMLWFRPKIGYNSFVESENVEAVIREGYEVGERVNFVVASSSRLPSDNHSIPQYRLPAFEYHMYTGTVVKISEGNGALQLTLNQLNRDVGTAPGTTVPSFDPEATLTIEAKDVSGRLDLLSPEIAGRMFTFRFNDSAPVRGRLLATYDSGYWEFLNYERTDTEGVVEPYLYLVHKNELTDVVAHVE